MKQTSIILNKINNIFKPTRLKKYSNKLKTKSYQAINQSIGRLTFKKKKTAKNIRKLNQELNKSIYKQERILEGFSTDVKKSINLIKLNDKLEIKPVGSYKYRVHSYPSDIDLFEKYEDCCDLKQVSTKIANKFKNIGQILLKNNKVFLGEVKIGYDMDLYINYGTINYKNKKIKGYDYKKINQYLIKIKNNKLINEKTYKQIQKIIKPRPTLLEFLKIHDTIRNLFVLRWNINELVKGYKLLRNKKVTIEECLQHQTITKMDIWAPINNNYTEITNFYYLIFKNKDGKITFLCKELDNYIGSLDNDIYQYESIEFRNSLKLAKRIWIKYNLLNKDRLLTKLYPLFKSSAAKLNQIKEEMLVVNDLLNRYINQIDKNLNKNFIKHVLPILKNQIEGFKIRINDIFEIELDYKKIFKHLNENI